MNLPKARSAPSRRLKGRYLCWYEPLERWMVMGWDRTRRVWCWSFPGHSWWECRDLDVPRAYGPIPGSREPLPG